MICRSLATGIPTRNALYAAAIGHFGPPVQPAHLVAGFAERNVAPLQPADHLGGIVGIDKVGDTGHAQCAERGGAALDVEVHEDAAEVEYYVFNLIHKLL